MSIMSKISDTHQVTIDIQRCLLGPECSLIFINFLHNTMHLELPEKKHEKDYLEMIQEIVDNAETIIPRSLAMKE